MTTTSEITGRFPLGDRAVNRMGFGGMKLTGRRLMGPPADPEAALAVLRRAVALGVDHIDTSDTFGPRVVNELIHEALHPYPEDLVIVTKVGAHRAPDGAWAEAGTCGAAPGGPGQPGRPGARRAGRGQPRDPGAGRAGGAIPRRAV